MADDPDVVWLTYEEAATQLRIKADSVRRRAASRKWPRRLGNDGLARVGIPRGIIPDDTPAAIPDFIPTHPDNPDGIQVKLAAAETEVRLLREQIADLRADRDALREALAKAAAKRAGFFTRLFG